MITLPSGLSREGVTERGDAEALARTASGAARVIPPDSTRLFEVERLGI